jgi:hypothetical protein
VGEGEGIFEVEGGCVPFESGVEGDDELADGVGGEAGVNRGEVEGGAIVEGGEEMGKDVVEAAVGVGLLYGEGVAGGGDEAEGVGVSIMAKVAVVIIGKAAAGGAGGDGKCLKKGGEGGEIMGIPGKEVKGKPLGGPGSHSRELFEVVDEGEKVLRQFHLREYNR